MKKVTVTARPPQLYQRLGGGALSPEGPKVSIFVTSWDTHDHNNLHHPIMLSESTYSMHSD